VGSAFEENIVTFEEPDIVELPSPLPKAPKWKGREENRHTSLIPSCHSVCFKDPRLSHPPFYGVQLALPPLLYQLLPVILLRPLVHNLLLFLLTMTLLFLPCFARGWLLSWTRCNSCWILSLQEAPPSIYPHPRVHCLGLYVFFCHFSGFFPFSLFIFFLALVILWSFDCRLVQVVLVWTPRLQLTRASICSSRTFPKICWCPTSPMMFLLGTSSMNHTMSVFLQLQNLTSMIMVSLSLPIVLVPMFLGLFLIGHTYDFYVAEDWFGLNDLDLQFPVVPCRVVSNSPSPTPLFYYFSFHFLQVLWNSSHCCRLGNSAPSFIWVFRYSCFINFYTNMLPLFALGGSITTRRFFERHIVALESDPVIFNALLLPMRDPQPACTSRSVAPPSTYILSIRRRRWPNAHLVFFVRKFAFCVLPCLPWCHIPIVLCHLVSNFFAWGSECQPRT
jgi:hypothetical protein